MNKEEKKYQENMFKLVKIKKNVDLDKLKEFGYKEGKKYYFKSFEDKYETTIFEVSINKRSRRVIGYFYFDDTYEEDNKLTILLEFDFTGLFKIDLIEDLYDADLLDFIDRKKH